MRERNQTEQNSRESTDRGETRFQPGEDRAEPHALASELTGDRTVVASGGPVDVSDPAVTPERAAMRHPGDQPPRDKAITRTQKDVGRHMMVVVGVALAAALFVAALLLRNWVVFGLGLLVIIPFMIMVMAPYWLAATTKAAQDDAVRAQRGEHDPPRFSRNDLRE